MKKTIEVYEDKVIWDWDEEDNRFTSLAEHDIRDVLDEYKGKRVRITIEEIKE